MKRSETIIQLAQRIADERSDFFKPKGPGAGNKDTNSFMRELGTRVRDALGVNVSEQDICGDNKLAVDFYVPDEDTIIEVALSLRNSNSEFERDILKALMAKECGHSVKRLVFVSKPGAIKRHKQPSSKAIVSWVKRNHQITIEIRELEPTGG